MNTIHNYSTPIPEGYVLDPNSGLYYMQVPGNDQATGQDGRLVTFFYPNGEYKQYFYPNTAATKENAAKKIFIIALAAVLLLAVMGAGASFLVMNSGKNYLYRVVARSGSAYAKETKAFVDGNSIFQQIDKINKGSNQHILTTPGMFAVGYSNDKENQIALLEFTIDELPIKFEGYLSNDAFVFGNRSVTYLEADPKQLGTDIYAFAEKNRSLLRLTGIDIDMYTELRDIVDEVDFSYSNLLSMYQDYEKMSIKNAAELNKILISLSKGLVERADYERKRGSTLVGGKEVKANILTLTLDPDAIVDWFATDVRDGLSAYFDLALQSNDNEIMTALEKLYDWIADEFGGGYYYYYYDNPFSYQQEMYDEMFEYYDDFLDELAQNLKSNLVITLDVHKNVIVKAELSFIAFDEEVFLAIGAVGEKYRLNDMFLRIKYDDEVREISMAGEHIGTDQFTSSIQAAEYDDDGWYDIYTIDIKWDLDKAADNLKIYYQNVWGWDSDSDNSDSEILTLTFARDINDIVFAYHFEGTQLRYTLSPLTVPLKVPSDTIKMRDASLEDLMTMFSDSGSGMEF